MLSIFRTNQLLVSTLLIFYAAVLHLSVFILPDTWSPGPVGVLSQWVYTAIGGSGLWPDLLAILLVFVQAVTINVVAIDYRLTDEPSLFPGLFYVLVSSLLPDFLHLSPLLMANSFLLIALIELLPIYQRAGKANNIFNVGFWVAVASLFYFAYVAFLLLGLVGLTVLRAFRFRERLMMMAGFLTPYWLLGVYYFWTDQLDVLLAQQFGANFSWPTIPAIADPLLYVKLGAFGLLLLVVLFSYNNYLFKKNMRVKKKITLLYWTLLLGGLALFIQAGVQLDFLLILAIPLGIFLSINFLSLPRRGAEVLHLLLLIAVLLLQYRVFLFGG